MVASAVGLARPAPAGRTPATGPEGQRVDRRAGGLLPNAL